MENGSTRSRAIENIIRVVAVWIASVQTRDRDGDVDEEDPAERVAEPAGEHVGQALRRVAEAAVGDARRGHQRGEQHERAADAGDDERPEDRARGGAARVLRVSSDSSPALSKPTMT